MQRLHENTNEVNELEHKSRCSAHSIAVDGGRLQDMNNSRSTQNSHGEHIDVCMTIDKKLDAVIKTSLQS
jgi:hypothetical protein